MTVLKEEVGECCPPRKRLCLSVNRNKQLSQLGVDESKSSSDAQTSMAMPIEPGKSISTALIKSEQIPYLEISIKWLCKLKK